MFAIPTLRYLAQVLLEDGENQEAASLLSRVAQLQEKTRVVPHDAGPADVPQITQPEVRFVSPPENSEIKGDAVDVQVAFFSPMPLSRYRVWINGRSFGNKNGFDLPLPGPKGQILEKGRILEKGYVLEKGGTLSTSEERAQVAAELPADIADLARQRKYAYFVQIKLTIPVEDTDGAFLHIAIQAETTRGIVSDRQILRLRRPQAEVNRGISESAGDRHK